MLKIFKFFLSKVWGDLKQIAGYPECDYGENFSVDYDRYWKKRRGGNGPFFSKWQKQRADQTLDIIEPGSSVLDIACGDGAALNYMHEKAGVKGYGVDIDPSVLKIANDLGIETVCIDINNVDYVNSLPIVDYVTAFEILEHMPVPEILVANILKKANKGLIFSVPNSGYYAHRLRFLFGKFPLQWIVHPGEHLRFWTVSDMEFWIQSLGCEIEKMVLYEGLPILNKIFPKLFAQGIIVFVKDKKSVK